MDKLRAQMSEVNFGLLMEPVDKLFTKIMQYCDEESIEAVRSYIDGVWQIIHMFVGRLVWEIFADPH